MLNSIYVVVNFVQNFPLNVNLFWIPRRWNQKVFLFTSEQSFPFLICNTRIILLQPLSTPSLAGGMRTTCGWYWPVAITTVWNRVAVLCDLLLWRTIQEYPFHNLLPGFNLHTTRCDVFEFELPYTRPLPIRVRGGETDCFEIAGLTQQPLVSFLAKDIR